MLFTVIKNASATNQHRRHRDLGIDLQFSFFNHGSCRHNLAGRSGFINVGNRTIATNGNLARGRLVGIKGRRCRHRQNVSRAWIHHDNCSALSSTLSHFGSYGLLRHPLDVAVNRQAHVAAIERRSDLVGARWNLATARARFHRLLTGGTGQS